jgi:hypothetical protein
VIAAVEQRVVAAGDAVGDLPAGAGEDVDQFQ